MGGRSFPGEMDLGVVCLFGGSGKERGRGSCIMFVLYVGCEGSICGT